MTPRVTESCRYGSAKPTSVGKVVLVIVLVFRWPRVAFRTGRPLLLLLSRGGRLRALAEAAGADLPPSVRGRLGLLLDEPLRGHFVHIGLFGFVGPRGGGGFG